MSSTVIDTCCLINLYASRQLTEIIKASIEKAVIPNEVLSEGLYVREESEDDPDILLPKKVDFLPFVNAGVLELTEPTGSAELESYIQLAEIIDDGEASCLAIAYNRGFTLATDDRRAINVANDLNVSLVTTPDLIQEWIHHKSPNKNQIRDIIRCIERYGRFRPHPSNPKSRWWDTYR